MLVALVLIALSASWALQATAATERAVGDARARADALQRAARALADLQVLPCDSTRVTRTIVEPRWQVSATRVDLASARYDVVQLVTVRGDTLHAAAHRWCAA